MKTHKQELLDLAHDIGHADEVTVANLFDNRASAMRATLPGKYVGWIVTALTKLAEAQ